jgi:hypothetical protein
VSGVTRWSGILIGGWEGKHSRWLRTKARGSNVHEGDSKPAPLKNTRVRHPTVARVLPSQLSKDALGADSRGEQLRF